MGLGLNVARMKGVKFKEDDWIFTEQSSASIQTEFSSHSSMVDSQVILNPEHSLNNYSTGLEYTTLVPINFPETTYIKHVADLKKAFESPKLHIRYEKVS